MGEVIKVIDLLNMIADGEKLPKKIKYDLDVYTRTDNMNYYTYFDGEDYITHHIMEYLRCGDLNDDIIILEDEEEINIQSIEEIDEYNPSKHNFVDIVNNQKETINKLIQAVKQLDNKLKEK